MIKTPNKKTYFSYFKLSLILIIVFSFTSVITAEDMKKSHEKKIKPYIVKIYATYQSYNSFYPWEKKRFNEQSAFGTVLDKNYILTTADTISDSTYIELKKNSDETKYPAHIVFVDYSSNIVLLKADDENFYNDLSSLPLGKGIKKSDSIELVQIQKNNSIKSIKGTLEKVSVEDSFIGWDKHLSYHLSIKLDQREHWADPVIKDGFLEGILTSYDANRFIAKVIPVELIKHFLHDISDGKYDGFPDSGFYWEPLKNPLFKEYLGMDKKTTGVYVARVVPGSSADGALQKGDILLSLDNKEINDNGYFIDDTHGKLKLSYLFTRNFPDNILPAVILRNGKKTTVKLTLKNYTSKDYLIPVYNFDSQPKYLIEGGLVIQEVTTDYLKTWGKNWQDVGNKRLLYYYNYFARSPLDDRKRLIMLSFVLPDDINIGYQNFRYQIITKINGKKITNLEDAANAIDSSKSEFVHILFQGTKEIILKKSFLETANKRISERYNIHKLRNL